MSAGQAAAVGRGSVGGDHVHERGVRPLRWWFAIEGSTALRRRDEYLRWPPGPDVNVDIEVPLDRFGKVVSSLQEANSRGHETRSGRYHEARRRR
jgi:hypothetical protein